MKYDIEIDVEDLGLSTDDCISLAEDNGDRLYEQDELDERIELALEDKYSDLHAEIETHKEDVAFLSLRNQELAGEIHSLRNEGFIENTKTTIKDLEEEVAFLLNVIEEMKATAKASPSEREAIGLFIQNALRIEAIGIADCIRRGDYNA